MTEASIQETIEKVLQGQQDMPKDFTTKLSDAITTVTEKINQVTSDHTTFAQTITKLCSVVMQEPGQNALNLVIVPPTANA